MRGFFEQFVRPNDAALNFGATQRAVESDEEVVDDAREIGCVVFGGRLVSEQGADAFAVVGSYRVIDGSLSGGRIGACRLRFLHRPARDPLPHWGVRPLKISPGRCGRSQIRHGCSYSA